MSLLDSIQMPHAVSVWGPPSVTRDATSGAMVETWPTLRRANVPCWIFQGTGGERDEFDQTQRPVATHSIVLGDYNEVEPGDKLIDDATGLTYRFTGARPQQYAGGIPAWNMISVRQMD